MQFYKDKDWTPKEKVTRAAKFHRIAGYFMLFIGNATVMTGAWHYFQDIMADSSLVPIGFMSLVTFCLLVMLCECFYRRENRKATMVVETPDVHDPNKRMS